MMVVFYVSLFLFFSFLVVYICFNSKNEFNSNSVRYIVYIRRVGMIRYHSLFFPPRRASDPYSSPYLPACHVLRYNVILVNISIFFLK